MQCWRLNHVAIVYWSNSCTSNVPLTACAQRRLHRVRQGPGDDERWQFWRLGSTRRRGNERSRSATIPTSRSAAASRRRRPREADFSSSSFDLQNLRKAPRRSNGRCRLDRSLSFIHKMHGTGLNIKLIYRVVRKNRWLLKPYKDARIENVICQENHNWRHLSRINDHIWTTAAGKTKDGVAGLDDEWRREKFDLRRIKEKVSWWVILANLAAAGVVGILINMPRGRAWEIWKPCIV